MPDIYFCWIFDYQGPHSPILMTGGGGSDRGSYLIPKKTQLQNLSSQKNHYFNLHTQKNPLGQNNLISGSTYPTGPVFVESRKKIKNSPKIFICM